MRSLLASQTFSSSLLNRSILERRDVDILERALPKAKVLLVAGSQCCVKISGESPDSLHWLGPEELQRQGFQQKSGTLNFRNGRIALVPYLLGYESSQERWKMAADISSIQKELKGLEFRELRSLLDCLDMDSLAVAGHAVALGHSAMQAIDRAYKNVKGLTFVEMQSNPFCSRCGAPNKQIEAGSKVQCTANEKHKAYPRTDPVAIMMVEDKTGTRALLGRPKKLRSVVLTCLSGFIEQGESIEEAVRREVFEEAGVRIGQVDLVGSQPWPIGRGGSCELMVGCIAKAEGDDLHKDEGEMDDVRWISKADVRAAIAASSSGSYDGGPRIAPGLDFFIPPAWAIAHHLIKTWAERSDPWFAKL